MKNTKVAILRRLNQNQHNPTCHPQTGQCPCPPGSEGKDCSTPCPKDRFGPDCAQVRVLL